MTNKQNVLGVTGPSGSGKTTLIEYLVRQLASHGWKVNVIKHSHHDFELEPPRKDSARFRHAGAAEVMIASPYVSLSSTSCAARTSPAPTSNWPGCNPLT